MTDRLAQIVQAAADLQSLPAADRWAAYQALPESERLAIVRQAGAVPAACGDAAPVAPARGPGRMVDFVAAYPKGDRDTEVKPAGHAGRRTVVLLDNIEVMRAQARRRGGSFGLTDEQVGMARLYATLVQTLAAGAVRCVSLEGQTGGGGTREGFVDHRLALHRRVESLQARIGPGCSMAVRRVRPCARGATGTARVNITDRAVVDMVCLHGLTLSDVLARHGWSVKGDTVRAATQALADALDRMIGPRGAPIRAASFGVRCDFPILREDGCLTA